MKTTKPLREHFKHKHKKVFIISCVSLLAFFAIAIAPLKNEMSFLYLLLPFFGILSGVSINKISPSPLKIVSDSNLESLAEDAIIPEKVKIQVANILSERGKLVYSDLWQIDANYCADIEQQAASSKPGYAKIMAHVKQVDR